MRERVEYLQGRIERLKRLQRCTLEEYLRDETLRDAVERNFQVAVECCTDIASHIIAGRGLRHPDKRRAVFQMLAQEGLLSWDRAGMMADLVGLRNRLVHLYLTVDPVKMYQYLQEDVAHLETFLAFVIGYLEREAAQ